MALAEVLDDSPAQEKARPSPHRGWIALTGFIFGLLYLPLFVLVLYSFWDTQSENLWTFKWYQELLQDAQLLESLWNSLWIGLWCTLFSGVLGTALALALERRRFRGRWFFENLNMVPLIMPEIVLGLSLLVWFGLIQRAFLAMGLEFSLGLLTLTLAHITFCLAYVVITVQSRLKDFDHSLEEAARDLGASEWQTFWKVTFPLIWPAILSGSLLAFTISFDDFMISYFTTGVGNDPLPVKLYSMIRFGVSPKVNAISTLILGFTILLVLLVFRRKARRPLSRRHSH